MSSPDDAVAFPCDGPMMATIDAGDAPADPPDGVPDPLVRQVLAALAEMALRSKRRQADLHAALRHAGIQATPARVAAVLELLRARAWVSQVVALHDGGVLLSVTALGLEALRRRAAT